MLAGAGVYYYILEEYKVSNGLLTEDIYVRICIHSSFTTAEDLQEKDAFDGLPASWNWS